MPPSEYATLSDIYRFGLNETALKGISWEQDFQPVVRAVSARFDSALGSSHKLPLTDWGDDVRSAVAVIAAWDVYSVKGVRPGDDVENHPLRLRALEAQKWIRGVAEGTFYPTVTDSSPPAVAGAVTADGPIVTSNEPRGYAVVQGGSNDFWGAALPFQGRRGT